MGVSRSARALPRATAALAGVLIAGLAAGCGMTIAAARARSALASATRGSWPAGPRATAISRFRWSELPASPLGQRPQPVLAWTGRELLELGGSGGGPAASAGESAAFNPATGRWRRIAATPGDVGISGAVSVWTGRQLFVTDGAFVPCPALPGGGTPANCGPHAGLYDPAADRWSQTPLPKPVWGLDLMAAVWTGREVILAGVQTRDGRVGVAAYDPAAHHWQMITPRLPAQHPARVLSMVAAGGRVILWSLWDKGTAHASGGSEQAGVDVLALSGNGAWRNVTGSWPQNQQVTSPLFTGAAILVSPGQRWCGVACKDAYSASLGYFADPATLARTIIPAGPLGQADPAFVWTGHAIIAVDLDATIGAHGGQPRSAPATSRCGIRLPAVGATCPPRPRASPWQPPRSGLGPRCSRSPAPVTCSCSTADRRSQAGAAARPRRRVRRTRSCQRPTREVTLWGTKPCRA